MRISDWSSDVCSSDLIASRSPTLWSALLDCANRTFVSELLNSEEPIFFAEPLKSGRPGWWGLPIGSNADQKSTRFVANLDADWTGFFAKKKPSRSEEHTSELQSLMRISYAVFCLKKKN